MSVDEGDPGKTLRRTSLTEEALRYFQVVVRPHLPLRQCPDLRLAMLNTARSPYGEGFVENHYREENQDAARRLIPLSLRQGQLWWVSDEMTTLVDNAAATMPDFLLMPTDPPDAYGVVFFQHPLRGVEAGTPYAMKSLPGETPEVYVSAMSWFAARGPTAEGGDRLDIISWTLLIPEAMDTGDDGWRMIGTASWRLGEGLRSTVDYDDEAVAESVVEDRSRLAALWLLAKQETIAERRIQGVERSSARRSERADVPVSDIVVLQLRRRHARKDEDEAGTLDREWTHRWLVSGHWRNQWLPSEDRHRPTWIAPYVKGPDDKPLVIKERIKALVR